jgi:hypothetical protein
VLTEGMGAGVQEVCPTEGRVQRGGVEEEGCREEDGAESGYGGCRGRVNCSIGVIGRGDGTSGGHGEGVGEHQPRNMGISGRDWKVDGSGRGFKKGGDKGGQGNGVHKVDKQMETEEKEDDSEEDEESVEEEEKEEKGDDGKEDEG